MNFSLTALNVLVLVALAIPGYILIKTKVVKPQAIPALSAVLLYVNQPFLTIHSFNQIAYSVHFLENLGYAFVFSFFVQSLMFGIMWLVFKKKFELPILQLNGAKRNHKSSFLQTNADSFRENAQESRKGATYRVLNLACTFGNVGFLGFPIVKALLPLAPEAIAYAAVFTVTMNMLCWTVGVAVLTGDRKHISLKKALFNPPTAALIVALPIFFTGVQMPTAISSGISFLGEMTTPLSMLILGMRFATSPLKELFTNRKTWLSSIVKNIVFPLVAFAVLYFLPIDNTIKVTLYILSAMPSAAIVLSISELYKSDTVTAANAVLQSSLLCVLTVPVLMLLTF